MTNSAAVNALRQLLVGQYEELKNILTRRLGSEDVASDALQETYMRLERPIEIGVVKSPKQYLLTIATNIARMSFRRGRRSMDLSELDAAIGFVDEAPNPQETLEARQDLDLLQDAFDELTPRRRHIIFASRVNGVQLSDIAEQLGVSKRLVEKELRIALMLCASKVNRKVAPRFGSLASQASSQQAAENALHEERDDEV